MHLSPNFRYPWLLRLTHKELTVIQKCLEFEELDDKEASVADHLADSLRLIRPKAEATLKRYNRKSDRED